MFCANCGQALEPVDDILSQDLWGGDYYTHHCPGCNTYWHLHIHSGNVDLISTGAKQEIASKKITGDLVAVLREKATELEKV